MRSFNNQKPPRKSLVSTEQFPAPKVMAHPSINLHPQGLAQDFREEATYDSFEGLNPSTGVGSGQDLGAKLVPLFAVWGSSPE